ncbi:MAG: DUF481 domain-containing protein [Planctomycetota bacterium]
MKVKGTLLRGRVVNITSAGVIFLTEYGQGKITIPFADIESLTTEKPLHVIHGDIGDTFGRIIGVQEGQLLVGEDPVTAERIETSTILETDTEEELQSVMERLRNRYRFWSATLDIGVSYQASTSDETDITAGFSIERKKKPTRLFLKVDYIFGRDKESGEDSVESDNQLRALLKGEYDFSNRGYVFMSSDYEYDSIKRLSARWVGKLGPGYRIIKNARADVGLEVGGARVHRSFFGGDTEDNWSISIGTEGNVKLPYGGALLRFSGDYLPSLDDSTDYILRGSASVEFPLSTHLALKASVINVYDNTPDPGSDKNDFQTLMSLSWRF